MTRVEVVQDIRDLVDEEQREEEKTIELVQTPFAIRVDGSGFKQPEVTREMEIENDSNMTSVSDQCGNVERNTLGNQGWNIRVSGIVTNERRENNLSLQELRDIIAPSDTIEIQSEIIGGAAEFELSNTVITQRSDIPAIRTPSTNDIEQAFEFQLQIGETDT